MPSSGSRETSPTGRDTREYRGDSVGQRPRTGVKDFEQHIREIADREQKSSSDEEHTYEKDSARTVEKERIEKKLRHYKERYEAAMKILEDYDEKYGDFNYKDPKEANRLTGNRNAYRFSRNTKYTLLYTQGPLADLGNARRSDAEFETNKSLVNFYLKKFEDDVKVLEYLAKTLDTENPPSSIEFQEEVN